MSDNLGLEDTGRGGHGLKAGLNETADFCMAQLLITELI
jgi:hypothetical protein